MTVMSSFCLCLSLKVNFIGVTVDPDSFYVHFANTRHMFEPVAVGGTSPPVQVYELYNGGARVVSYELDTEPLAQVQAVSIIFTLLSLALVTARLIIIETLSKIYQCLYFSLPPVILRGLYCVQQNVLYLRGAMIKLNCEELNQEKKAVQNITSLVKKQVRALLVGRAVPSGTSLYDIFSC